MSDLGKLWALVSGVHNPAPALLDRLGMRHTPYRLRIRNGATIELRPRAGDLFGFYEIMLRRDYLSSGQELVSGATVIDIGANIGCFSILAANLVGPEGRVIAVEPDASTYAQLVRNVSLNGLSNVTAVNCAVGGRNGTITLHSDPNRLFSSVFSSVNGRAVQGRDQEVQMMTLNELMDAHHVERCDYLKLDCEGAEHEIIAGMSQDTARRIGQITMEVHKVPDCDPRQLGSCLEGLGYRRVGTATLPFYTR